eukprot:GHVU01148436.1.p1 GENE.GHVU01148436.1~~GHVU01148436.1.p1  ORF type:complete len:214 (-),score=37.72 GHVU01148436.1:121-762(-)
MCVSASAGSRLRGGPQSATARDSLRGCERAWLRPWVRGWLRASVRREGVNAPTPPRQRCLLTRGSTAVNCVHHLQQLTEWLDESAEYNDVNMVGGPHAELRAALLSFLKHLQKDPFETRVATFVTECVGERLKTGGDMQLLRGDAYRTQFDPLLFWLGAIVPSLSKLGGDVVNRLLIAFAPIANTYATTTPSSAEAPHPLLMHRFVAFVEVRE